MAEDILFDLLNVPPLRFPEFKGEWKKSQLGSVVSNKCQKYTPSLNEHLFDIELDSIESDNGICSNFYDSSTQKSVKNCFTSQNVLYGKLRPYLNKWYLPKQNGVCSSEIWVLSSKALKRAFLFSIIQGKSFKSGSNVSSGSKMPRADWNYIESIPVSFPGDEEQEKIGLFVLLIEKRIEVQRKIIKDLSDLIVSIRSYLFNGSAETSSMSLDSLFGLVTSRNTSEKPLIVFSACGQKGLIPENLYYKKKISSASTKNYFEIENNDYVYSKSSSAGFPFGSFNRFEGTEGLVSPLYIVLRPKKTINSEYLETWFKSDNCKKQLRQICQEGARNHGLLNISTKDFLSLEIPVIDLNNQMHLISLCKARLALSTAELDSLSRLKSFLLSSLFC